MATIEIVECWWTRRCVIRKANTLKNPSTFL